MNLEPAQYNNKQDLETKAQNGALSITTADMSFANIMQLRCDISGLN